MQDGTAQHRATAPDGARQSGAWLRERAREQSPRRSANVDGAERAEFDDLTELTARLCATPIAVVSLVDSDRLWFTSRIDVEIHQIERLGSFWEYAVNRSTVTVVPDARAYPPFSDHPMVSGAPGIRFYAGAPLVTDTGVAVGTLSVMDIAPRILDPSQLADLAMLARRVVSQLDLRRQTQMLTAEIAAKTLAESELRKSRHLLDEILAHTDVLVYAKDLDGRFLMANTAVEQTIGRGRGALVGRTVEEVFPPAAVESFRRNDSRIVEEGSWEVFQEELEFPDGSVHSYRSTKFPLVDEYGRVYAVAGVSTDITELAAVRAEMQESVSRFRALFDHSPVGIALSDEDGLWFEANAAFGRLLGVDPSEMVGHSALDFAHPDDHALIAGSELGQLASPDGVMRAEMRFVQTDGSVRCAWVNVTPLPGPNGEHWTLGLAQDITERKEAETALRRSEEELAAIAAVARCVQSGTDPRPVVVESVRSLSGASVVRLLEPSAAQSLSVTAEAGTDPADDSPFAVESTAESVRRSGRAVLLPLDPSDVAGADRTPTLVPAGSALWQPVVVESEVIAVLQVTWAERVAGLEARQVQAVRALAGEAGASLHAAQLRTELERFAATDSLTGALNRRAWEAHLSALIEQSRADGSLLTIALIDLDNFKAFNDTFGHGAGDELLQNFAAAVREQLRSTDLFARWGGEEFILALTNCDSVQAAGILNRIRTAVPGRQTCSIGHTVLQPGESMATCFGRADATLYLAKGGGRDRVVAG